MLFCVRRRLVKHRAGLKLASRDYLNHLTKEKRACVTHVAVIKRLTLRCVSTGCLLHLSLIWLLGSRSLTGIQSSPSTVLRRRHSLQRLDGTRGGKPLQQSGPVNKHLFYPLALAFSPLPSRGPSSPSLPPSARSDKVHRLKSAARNSTCLCKWLSSLSLPRFQGLNTLKVKSHFPGLAAQRARSSVNLHQPLTITASWSQNSGAAWFIVALNNLSVVEISHQRGSIRASLFLISACG